MASDNTNQNNNAIDNLNESLTGLSAKVHKNQKIIFIIAGALGVVVLGVLVWLFAFRAPAIQKANAAVGQADIELALGNDSVALKLYMDVANNHSYDAGNRASLMAAILLYREGKYDEALKYIDKFEATEKVVGPAAYSLMGDCYVNTDKLPQAVEAYKKAIKQTDDNPAYTPFFMLKLARVYREQKNYAEEAEIYKTIEKDYPQYVQNNGIDIQKYIQRAETQAGK